MDGVGLGSEAHSFETPTLVFAAVSAALASESQGVP